jgi:hypothetical protein
MPLRISSAKLAISFICVAGAAIAATAYAWVEVPSRQNEVSVRNAPYVIENSGKPWSLKRAGDSPSDIIRFEVRAGDQWSEDKESGENKERSELDGYKRRWTGKKPVWGAYSFFIEPGELYASDWTSIVQMHGSEARPFALLYKKNQLIIFTEHLENGKAVQTEVYRGGLDRGVWHNVAFTLEQGSEDGRLKLWLDRNKIVDFKGPIGTDRNAAYWKFGIYRGYGPIAASIAVQYANMDVGYADLSKRILEPLPVR